MIIRLLALVALLSLVACGEPESIHGEWKLAWTSCEGLAGADGDLDIGSDDHFVTHLWTKDAGLWIEGDLLQTSDNQWKVSAVKITGCTADQSECQTVPNAGGASMELGDDGKLRLISQCPTVYVR